MEFILQVLVRKESLSGAPRQSMFFGSEQSAYTQRRQSDNLGRHAGSPDAFITQLAFSPSQNIIAWADSGGTITWWRDPIPAGSPDPVKATAAGGVQGVAVKRKSTPTFRGEDAVNGDHGGNAGTVDDYGDDWIIDDIGVGMDDEHGKKHAVDGDGFVKEMGTFIKIACYSCSERSGSEHYKGAASFPARIDANGGQETIPR